MDIKKVEAIWLAAAVKTYEICKQNPDWKLDDIFFSQSEIVKKALSLSELDTIPPVLASQQTCAHTGGAVYNYLVSKDVKRRISYTYEFRGIKERPQLDAMLKLNTSAGTITCHELMDFIDREFTPKFKSLWKDRSSQYSIEPIFQYIEDYVGSKFVAVEKAGEKASYMAEHKKRGIEARKILYNLTNEIKAYMTMFSTINVTNWINQGQRVNHYLWAELRKKGKENSPTSMSISIEKMGEICQMRVSVEAKDTWCKSREDLERHNRLLEKENTNTDLHYYIADESKQFLVQTDLNREQLKKLVEEGTCDKVQICKTLSREELLQMTGSEVFEFIIHAIQELEPFYDLSVEGNFLIDRMKEEEEHTNEEDTDIDTIEYNKNMILCGPPGTGKTYNSAIYAVALCDGQLIETVKETPYDEVLKRYQELKQDGRVAFTTFHQSYGYEEFIEGIRPVMHKQDDEENSDVKYEIADGIFKRFCRKAQEITIKSKSIPEHKNPNVWCVLLDGSGTSELKKRCFEQDCIRIGWPEKEPYITEQTSNITGILRSILLNFQENMEVGDIVLTQHSNKTIDGIGIITQDYEYDPTDVEYPRKRMVKWIAKNINEDVYRMNQNTKLDRKTVYPLRKVNFDDVKALIEKNHTHEQVQVEENKKPYVFIIDEINRGNISKIFGELITLIEPTKRTGAKEGMKAILPYTKVEFGVPKNVYILGTMNTADRSISLMDTALRRRFQFVEMMPDTDVLRYLGLDQFILQDSSVLDIAQMLDTINNRIEVLYDREHTIGHAFFTSLENNKTIDALAEIFQKSVIPLLQEYFYEDYSKIRLVLGDNGKANEHQFITEQHVKTREIFWGAPDIDVPEAQYQIQTEAFYKAESYLGIYKQI